jgi:flagellum-specific peptidoglycan hydrolase FlgJ
MDSLKLLTLCLALGTVSSAVGQNTSRAEYIERYKNIAIEHAEKYGIPASVKMAQGILESGYGNGALARKGNTHFNIKVKASDNWRGEVVYHDDDRPNEPFRAYSTPEDSWLDHSEYLDTQPRYDSLFRYSVTDYRSWARGLKNAGYATDPLYAEKLVRVIEENRLWELDGESAALAQTPGRVAVSGGGTAGGGLVDPDRYVVVMQRRGRR